MTRAEDVPAELKRQVESIRNNKSLTPAAKKIRLARAYLDAKSEQAARLAAVAAEKAERRRFLERRLFGSQLSAAADPTTIVAEQASFRDALGRAAATDEAGRQALLDQAEIVGDEGMARACATVAFSRAEIDTVNSWLTDRPVFDKYANELWPLTHDATSATGTAGWHLANALDAPAELEGYGEITLSQLAQQDEKQAAAT